MNIRAVTDTPDESRSIERLDKQVQVTITNFARGYVRNGDMNKEVEARKDAEQILNEWRNAHARVNELEASIKSLKSLPISGVIDNSLVRRDVVTHGNLTLAILQLEAELKAIELIPTQPERKPTQGIVCMESDDYQECM